MIEMIDLKMLAITFLEISKVDLDASRILYNEGLYAPAIFHLQQSVEKALKATLLLIGMAPQEEKALDEFLRKKVGHHVMENLSEIARHVMNIIKSKIKREIRKEIYRPYFLPLKIFEKTLETQLNAQCKEYQDEIKKFEKLEVLRSEKLEKVLDWVIKSSSESTLKAQLSRLKLLMKQLPLELSDFIIQIIIQVSRLCLLSLLVERFEEVSRYPNIIIPSIGPSLFTKDHPLTNKLEQLQKLTENSINKLDALFRDFSK